MSGVFEHIINLKILVMALKTIADVMSFLDNTGVIYEKGSIRRVRLPRCVEPAWEFRGVFRIYTLDVRGDLISAI